VFHALGREPDIEFIPTPERLRPTYQYFTEASMRKLRHAGYNKPFTELEDGIAAYVRDYLTQADPYR
jgi:ADP-L-glycero-D-manno-heptose 6-epimerase